MAEQNVTNQPRENLIPLNAAVEKYGSEARNILNWAKAGKITASRIGGTWFIDEESIRTRINLNKKISAYNTHLSEVIKEKEKLLQKLDHDIFILKNIYDLTPAFKLILIETSKLIPNEIEQAIFLDMVIGKKSIANLAKDYHRTIKTIVNIQKSNINIISAKIGFLQTYRNQLAQLYWEKRKLEFTLRTQMEQIKALSSLLPDKNVQTPPEEITPEIAQLLTTRLYDMELDVRTLNCFKSLNLNTLEDLLRLTKLNGFDGLLMCRNFGNKSLRSLKRTLVDADIIDENEWSYLYNYL